MGFLKQSMVIEVVKQDGQINILVVEDNNYIRNLTISLLEMQHYNVISASNAFDAMDLAMYYSAKFLDIYSEKFTRSQFGPDTPMAECDDSSAILSRFC